MVYLMRLMPDVPLEGECTVEEVVAAGDAECGAAKGVHRD